MAMEKKQGLTKEKEMKGSITRAFEDGSNEEKEELNSPSDEIPRIRLARAPRDSVLVVSNSNILEGSCGNCKGKEKEKDVEMIEMSTEEFESTEKNDREV